MALAWVSATTAGHTKKVSMNAMYALPSNHTYSFSFLVL